MKQIEKLAKDFSKTPITIRGPFTVDSGILNLIINEREIAYQAGFLKAREMALVCLNNGEFLANDHQVKDIEENIKNLGESEAE